MVSGSHQLKEGIMLGVVVITAAKLAGKWGQRLKISREACLD